jgi:hypothetical protein
VAKVDSEDKPKSADAIASAFTPEVREIIQAELPANHLEVIAALDELMGHVRIHPRQIERRAERNSNYMAERERWLEAEKLVLRLVNIFREGPLPFPDADLPTILSLHEAHKQILHRLARVDALIEANSGAKDSFCAMLYTSVLRIWTEIGGGKLRYSQRGNIPCGPLIRFLSAVIPPMLPPDVPAPTPRTFRTAVDIERGLREHTRKEVAKKLRKV